ncbi:MAG: 8-amino-7-oxononanoate synthase [Rikenellaceae bacterium]
MKTRLTDTLKVLESAGNLRVLPGVEHSGSSVVVEGRGLMNFSSNDYLSIATDMELRREFFESVDMTQMQMGATSSRLLSGNYSAHRELEKTLEELFGRAALTFSSGYGMNSGLLPAVVSSQTLILADKLVHASLIDGIKLSGAQYRRFKHQNFQQLEKYIKEAEGKFLEVIVVVESIYSMDGDVCDLRGLVEIKRKYPTVMLYVDEAHAIGVRGRRGLGVAEEMEVIGDIDFLCGTFGKAIGSVGAYAVCDRVVKEFLINRMRTLIFNTALPPLNMLWTEWVMQRLEGFTERREALERVSGLLRSGLMEKGYSMPSESHIIPVVVGQSIEAIALSERLRGEGVYALAVRPPTVPEGTSRLRLSLTSSVGENDVKKLIEII